MWDEETQGEAEVIILAYEINAAVFDKNETIKLYNR